MPKRLLVPTDFSDVALNACRYAGALAEAAGIVRIDVVHWYAPQTAPDALLIPPIQEIMEQRRDSLGSFVERAGLASTLDVRTKIEVGFASDEIVEYSRSYDWIVMGATGAGTVLEQVFGSVSSSVAQRASCPVLLVPGTAEFSAPKQVLFASSDLAVGQAVIDQLIAFNDHFHARVHFIHVRDSKNVSDDSFDREHLVQSLFSGADLEFAFEIAAVDAQSTEEGLQMYIAEHPVDLVVMATKQRGFWENFFHRSTVRQMALHPSVPLLVFHLP